MKIAYIGNFTQSHCTEVHIALALESLGHEVVRIQENEITDNASLYKCLPDLLLWTRTWPGFVTGEGLGGFRGLGIPTVSYHLDLYVGLQREEGLDTDLFWKTDYVFTPDGDPKSAEIFKAKGINHHWQKPGVFKPECYISDEPLSRDVIFVGSKGYHDEWKYRPKLIEWLRDTYGERFEHWGSDGRGTVRNDPLNRLYASTRVTVGDSLCLPGHTNYWSDRPYETLGRGGFLIMPFVPGLEKEFEDGEDLVSYEYGDFHELQYLIDYYLTHDVERERIRRNGHKKVKDNYTYDERLKTMLEVVNGRK